MRRDGLYQWRSVPVRLGIVRDLNLRQMACMAWGPWSGESED